MRDVEEAQHARPRHEGGGPPRGARREGHQVLQVVDRLRNDGPRLCRLGRLQGMARPAGREAWPPLLRLGQDRAGERQVRLHVARPAGARDGGDGREALDLPLLRQSRVGQRLPPRDARQAGDGPAGVVRRLDPLLRRLRGALQGRGGRVGDLERAVRPGARIRRNVLPHRQGHPCRPAECQDLLHGDSLPERLHVRPGAPQEGERARPRLVLHLPSLHAEPGHQLQDARRAAPRAREELQRLVRDHAGRGGLPVPARIRPRDPFPRVDRVLAGEVGPAPHHRRRRARHPLQRVHDD